MADVAREMTWFGFFNNLSVSTLITLYLSGWFWENPRIGLHYSSTIRNSIRYLDINVNTFY